MILWAIRSIHTGAYLRGESYDIMIFPSRFAADNYIAYKRLNPAYYESVEFRR